MLLIYTEKVTNRIRYIFDVIFSGVLGVEFNILSDKEEFLSSKRPKFSYGATKLKNEIFYKSSEILFERDIKTQEVVFEDYNGTPAFFQTHDPESFLPFDPFAASFYLVSRYEEYLPYVRDEYGRFRADKSMMMEKGLLEIPLVNIWASIIRDQIAARYKSFHPPEKKYRFIPTIDIDSAWLFRSKGLIRNLGGFMQQASRRDFKAMINRFRVNLGMERDPFDTYGQQIEIINRYDLEAIYFVLFSDYRPNDKNIPINNRKFSILIKTLGDYAQVGIHSSFHSSFNLEDLSLEISRLSAVLNKEITWARQHFTRLNLPTTYRNYLSNGITTDYSMGYMRNPGFRAGIADPFLFYDLDMDQVTALKVYPFSYAFVSQTEEMMDTRIQKAKEIIDKVKEVNGTMVIVWENAMLRKQPDDSGKLEFFEDVVRYGIESV
jgi:hypothetical protein